MQQLSEENDTQREKKQGNDQIGKQNLQRIFREQGVVNDVKDLIDALLAQRNTDEIMNKYENSFIAAQYKKVQKALIKAKQAINQEKKKKDNQNEKIETGIKFQDLKKIFQKQGVANDVKDLIEALLAQRNTDEIMNKYEDYFKVSEYKKVQKALIKGIQFIIDYQKKLKVTDKVSRIDKLFCNQVISNDLKQLKQAILNNNDYTNILLEYELNFTGRQFRKIKEILQSEELKLIMDPQLQQTYHAAASIFQKVKVDTTLVQKYLIFNQKDKLNEQILNLQEKISVRDFKILIDIMKSDELAQILKKYHLRFEKDKQTQIKQFFNKMQIKADLNQLIDPLITHNDKLVKIIMEKLSDNLTIKEYKKLQVALNSKQLRDIVGQKDKSIVFDEMFNEIKLNIIKLKETVLAQKSSQQILLSIDSIKNAPEYSTILSILQSKNFAQAFGIKVICPNKFENSIFSEVKQIISNKLQISFDLTQLVQKMAKNQTITETLQKYEDMMKIGQYKKLKQFLSSQDYQDLCKLVNQKHEIKQFAEKLKDIGLKQKEIQQIISQVQQKEDPKNILDKLGNLSKIKYNQVQKLLQFYLSKPKDYQQKKLKLRKFFQDKNFKYQNQVIQSLLIGKSKKQILEELQNEVTSKMYEKLLGWLDEMENIMKEFNQYQEQKSLFDQIFPKNQFRVDLTPLRKAILNQEPFQPCLQILKQNCTQQENENLKKAVQSKQFESLVKSIAKKKNQKVKIKQMVQLFKDQKFQSDITDIIKAFVKRENITQNILMLEKRIKPSEYKIVQKVIDSVEFIKIIEQSELFIKKWILVNQLFWEQNLKDIKLFHLKEAICRSQSIQNQIRLLSDFINPNEIQKVKKVVKQKRFILQLKKLQNKNYSKSKLQELSKLLSGIQYKKEELLECFLTGYDFTQTIEQIFEKEKPQNIMKFNSTFFSEQVKKFFIQNEIEHPKYVKKIPIYTGEKVMYWNQSLIQFRKQNSVRSCQKFFNFNNQIINNENQMIEVPLKVLECQNYTVFFQKNQEQVQYLPNVTVAEVKNIFQKTFKTSLNLNVKFQTEDNKYAIQSDETLLRECMSLKISVTYSVKLLIQICEEQKERQFQVESNQTIQQISQKVEKQAGIKKQNQRWYINADLITDTKKSIEELEIKSEVFRIYIDEQKTLEFYGFNKLSKINRSYFKEFYIEDDQQFVNNIKASQFPKPNYSQTFRNQILGYIFCAIKKHALIYSSLKHVQALVQESQKQDMLWRPPTSKEKCLFNQTYVIYHILKSSDTNLKIDLLRGLMSHVPVPLAYSNQKGEMCYLFNENFWVQNKAFNICSFGFDENVRGKSDLLNTVFESNFPIRDSLHKDCQGGIQIEYNVYKSDEYSVNLIDVSNDVEQSVKVQLAQASNLVLIHYKNQAENDIIDWLSKNQITCPRILIERDNQNAFSKERIPLREDQKRSNKTNIELNKYEIIEISDERQKAYYSKKINEIANGIQQFVRRNFEELIEKKKIQLWKFVDFLAKKSDERYLRFNQLLRVIQTSNQNLTSITNLFYEFKEIQLKLDNKNQPQKIQKMDQIKETAIKKGLAKPIRNIIEFYKQHSQLSSQIMAKLRVFLTLLRNQLFKDFNDLQLLAKSVQKKIKQGREDIFSIKKQLLQKIVKINKLTPSLTTEKVIECSKKFILENQNYQKPEDWEEIIKEIKTQFQFQIQPKAFSVQNFWREVIYMTKFDPSYKFTLQNIEYNLKEQIVSLGRKEVQDSQNFELINGDLLEMPTEYLKNIFQNQQEKKIMVVAIFGPQSSGKSTLLNYVLGCDFMSSAGRCTKGIYGTYFEISNKYIPNCQAILVLDTQGLFSNYENKKFSNRNGFDNKLVLFCLQVCDIIILNTKGDVTRECRQVLELAFDSTMLDSNNMPEIYFVLNLNGGQINSFQSREIQKFCDAIIKTNPDAKKVIKKTHAVGMPMAFNEIPRKSTAQFITKFLKPKLQPSGRFYNQTKKLCFQLMNLLTQRGKNKQGRTLQQAFTKMDQTWTTINKYPILTKYGSKALKKKEQQIKNWKRRKLQEFTRIVNKEKQVAQVLKADEIQEWHKKKIKYFDDTIDKYLKDYQVDFPQKPGEISINNLIREEYNDIDPMLKNAVTSFNVIIQEVKCKQQIRLADNKGFGDINRAINDVKQIATKYGKNITIEVKMQIFQRCWNSMRAQMQKKINRKQISFEIYTNLLQSYNNELSKRNHKNKSYKYPKVVIQRNDYFKNKYEYDIGNYALELQKNLKKSFEDNNLIFECSNQPPVINIEKKKGDITFKYLDMSKYFEQGKKTIYLTISKDSLRQSISYSSIQKIIKTKIQNSSLGDKFFGQLTKYLKNFGVIIKSQKLKKAIDEQINAGLWTIITQPYILTNDDIETLEQEYVQLKQTFWSYKVFAYKLNFFIKQIIQNFQQAKNQTHYNFKYFSAGQLHTFLNKQLSHNEKLTLNNYYTLSKIAIKIANIIIKVFVNQNCHHNDEFLSIKYEIENQIIQLIQKDLKSINIQIKNTDYFFEKQSYKSIDFQSFSQKSNKNNLNSFQGAMRAINQIKSQNISYEDKLTLYGVQSQVQFGDINQSKPFFSGKDKWQAWHKNKGKTRLKAQKDYIQLVQNLLFKYGKNQQVYMISKNSFEFRNQRQLQSIFESFSDCFDRKQLLNSYKKQIQKPYQSDDKLYLGCFIQNQISIKEAYKTNSILNKYLSKQYKEFLIEMKKSNFVKFLNEQLKYQTVLKEVLQEIKKQKIEEKSLQDCADKVINIVTSIIDEMNKDLSQASQRLRYDFIHQIHFYSFHLAWKIKEESEWKSKQKILKDFDARKCQQIQRFMQLTSGEPDKQNKACASKFIELYKKSLIKVIRKDVSTYLNKRKQQYRFDYSRTKVQVLIDDQLFKSTNAQKIFQYLIDPVTFVKDKYKNYEQQEVKKVIHQYKYCNFGKIMEDITKPLIQLRDSIGDDEKNIDQQIFQRANKDENINKHFIPLIVEVLLKGSINSKNDINLLIKKGKSFSVENKITQKENIKFLEDLKYSQIEITNLKIFLDFVVEEMKQLSQQPKKVQNYLNEQQIRNYRTSLAVDICKEVCPCCSRSCDVDMHQQKGHSVHRCDSGHQMRAIGGMRIKYEQNGQIKYKASIQKCEQLHPDSQFEFNGKPYTWTEFKLQNQNTWDLNFDVQNKRNEMNFKHYWQQAGKLICEHFQQKDKLPMIYVKHDSQELKKQTEQTP